MPLDRAGWSDTIRSHFVLCTFLGIIVLEMIREPLRALQDAEGGPRFVEILGGSLISGLGVAFGTWLIHHFLLRHLREKYFFHTDDREGRRQMYRGILVGFIAGAMGPVYVFVRALIPILALAFLFLIFLYARTFIRRAAVILRPGQYSRPVDILHLIFLYGAFVACFTILNSALVGVQERAFNGIARGDPHVVDCLYFTIVMMTTLGFGDITPVSPIARLLVSFEVIIAYLFFALLVGTITRGILPRDLPEDSSQEDPPEDR